MSDARLRELERRWKETNSPDDEAAYLLERVRVGDLTRERLELAAYCGHEGAMRAVGSNEPSLASAIYARYLEESGDSFAAWFRGLSCWGQGLAFRVCMFCVQLIMTPAALGHPGAQDVADSLDAWQRESTPLNAERCIKTAKRLINDLESGGVQEEFEAALWALAGATEFAFQEGEIWRGTPALVAEHVLEGLRAAAVGKPQEERLLGQVKTFILHGIGMTGDVPTRPGW